MHTWFITQRRAVGVLAGDRVNAHIYNTEESCRSAG